MPQEHTAAELYAHRIATDALLQELVLEVFEGKSSDRFARFASDVTAEVACTPDDRVGSVPGQWIRQEALRSLEQLLAPARKRFHPPKD